ncbi:MAG: DUF4760 domain-containing protein [Gammaproteobacteria bacterium]
MTAPAWSALISTVALIVTISVQVAAFRRDRFSRGIDAVRAMDARFESSEFRDLRRRAALYLIEKPQNDPSAREALVGVLNFFETLGFLYAKKVVDAYSVWHFFGSWLMPYYSASKHVIDELRTEDPSLYSDLGPLYQAVSKVEARKHPSKDTLHILSREAMDELLRSETVLPTTPRPSTTPL